MENNEIADRIDQLRQFYLTDRTKDIEWRKDALRKLYDNIKKHEQEIMDALAEDLSKSSFESYATEISIVYHEIKLYIKKIKKWSKAECKRTPLTLFPSHSKVVKEPYGVVLVIAPWNYPFQLLFNPLIAAIAAGNCVALKTSPNAPATAKVMDTIINEVFPQDYVSIFHGNRDVNQLLLAERFDYIFFTGSPKLGRVVMEAAAKNLTPVTLELGGKSPCIVDKDANIKLAARRIMWGKTLNSGQTCIAPDYLIVHRDIKDEFLLEAKNAIREMYGEDPQQSPDYPRIISSVAMLRLKTYLQEGSIIMGGKYDEDDQYIEPTIMENVPFTSPLMEEEIFGPIFPMMEFVHIEDVIAQLKEREKPLALYYFTKNKRNIHKMLNETSSGGVCINDTIIHCANERLPFGGIGNSGLGHYHGRYGFDTFTHLKAVVTSSSKIDIKLKYPPYENKLDNYKNLI